MAIQTLSFGYQLPQDGDQGPIVFPALSANIQQLNDHTHNGTNSSKIEGSAIVSLVEAIDLSLSSEVGSSGHWTQTVTMPTGVLYATTTMQFRDSVGNQVFPGIEFVSVTSYLLKYAAGAGTLTVLYN